VGVCVKISGHQQEVTVKGIGYYIDACGEEDRTFFDSCGLVPLPRLSGWIQRVAGCFRCPCSAVLLPVFHRELPVFFRYPCSLAVRRLISRRQEKYRFIALLFSLTDDVQADMALLCGCFRVIACNSQFTTFLTANGVPAEIILQAGDQEQKPAIDQTKRKGTAVNLSKTQNLQRLLWQREFGFPELPQPMRTNNSSKLVTEEIKDPTTFRTGVFGWQSCRRQIDGFQEAYLQAVSNSVSPMPEKEPEIVPESVVKKAIQAASSLE